MIWGLIWIFRHVKWLVGLGISITSQLSPKNISHCPWERGNCMVIVCTHAQLMGKVLGILSKWIVLKKYGKKSIAQGVKPSLSLSLMRFLIMQKIWRVLWALVICDANCTYTQYNRSITHYPVIYFQYWEIIYTLESTIDDGIMLIISQGGQELGLLSKPGHAWANKPRPWLGNGLSNKRLTQPGVSAPLMKAKKVLFKNLWVPFS